MTFTKTDSNSSNSVATSMSPYALSSESNIASERLSQSDRDAILSLIAKMQIMLPFLRDLSAEERRSLLGMGDKNRVFAGKVLEVVQQKSDFLPRSFDVEQFQQDLATYDRLSTILMSLNQLRDLLDATTMAIGTEAYENALIAYRHAKASGQGASLESMVTEMGQRFRKTKKKTSAKPKTAE